MNTQITPENFLEEITSDVKAAIKKFGKHTFYDKGAFEVMNMDKYVSVLKNMPAKDAGDKLLEVNKIKTYGETLQSGLMGELEIHQHMEDWEDIKHPILQIGY